MAKETNKSKTESMIQELRRGALVLAILSQLTHEKYGYLLRDRLSKQGLDIKEGTLYPMLRRLESQDLLNSRWEITENRPRRYYRISENGKQVYSQLRSQWRSLAQVMERLLAIDKEEDLA